MVRAVEHRHSEVDDRIAGQNPTRPGVLDSLFDRRHELPRNRTAEDIVDELEVTAARQWIQLDLAVAELTVAAGLFLVAAVRFGGGLDGLAIWDARWLQDH